MATSTSCPDWQALAAARDRSPQDPPGWESALRHLDECATCRREAVAADPTLAFRALPALELDVASEVEAMRLRVAALRGATAVVAPRRRAAELVARVHVSWRLAAAAAVAALAVFAGGNDHHDSTPVSRVAAAVASPAAQAPPAASPALAAELASQPVLDGLDKPFDHVVQWNGDNLSVILVVDQRLGV